MKAFIAKMAIKHRRTNVRAISVENKDISVTGRFFKLAKIQEEWDEDVNDPSSLIQYLKNTDARIANPTMHSIMKKDPLKAERQDLLRKLEKSWIP